jgi:hypothetical protein
MTGSSAPSDDAAQPAIAAAVVVHDGRVNPSPQAVLLRLDCEPWLVGFGGFGGGTSQPTRS